MIKFAFYIHNHQPPGNFDEVFESAYRTAYAPLLKELLKHKRIKFGLHYSGPLLEWIVKNHPEHLEQLKDGIKEERIEILGSAYGEPILSMIPKRDLIKQIKFFSDYLNEIFGIRPRGLWLTERVWEPNLIPLLVEAGIEYTLVDDTVLIREGITSRAFNSYYITEAGGKTLKIFPISMDLRYMIPFQKLKKIKDFFARSLKNRLWISADDGEKFGFWPDTYGQVYQKGWLNHFLDYLEKSSFIETVLLHNLISLKPAGRIYLPSSSYAEMEEWVLPPARARVYKRLKKNMKTSYQTFLRGGYFHNFLCKYPEANLMHKRMLYVSKNIKHNKKNTASLWKAQSACAYWHGLFGGIYLPHLRAAVYKNLLEAETSPKNPQLEKFDFDRDGQDELVYKDKNFFFVLNSNQGSFIEFDDRKTKRNLLNVLGRHPEVYHKKGVLYDKYPRAFGIEHNLSKIPSLNDFIRGNINEIINYEHFRVLDIKPLKLKFSGAIEKLIELNPENKRMINFRYRGRRRYLGIEFSLGLFSPRIYINKKIYKAKKLKINQAGEFMIEDAELKLSFYANKKFLFLSYPIETISLSEKGQERIFQGLGIMLVFKGLPEMRLML